MPHHQSQLERQLQHAKSSLAACLQTLDLEGVDAKQRKRNPRWRQLQSTCRHIEARLRTAAATVALDQEVKQRKADKIAAKIAGQQPQQEEKKTKKTKSVSKVDKAAAKEKEKMETKKKNAKQKGTKKKKTG